MRDIPSTRCGRALKLGWLRHPDLIVLLSFVVWAGAVAAAEPPWTSPNQYRLLLEVDARGLHRSHAPATIEVDFQKVLSEQQAGGAFDQDTIEVVAFGSDNAPKIFNPARPADERFLLPWWLESFYGISAATLHFVVPDESCRVVAVYFDTVQSRRGRPDRYPGLVGDGDFFRETYGRREIGAHHFDCFADLDRDGDLDLFKGGVEPFIACYENTGSNRYVSRGKLTSGGRVFLLPHNQGNNRSWVVPHFDDWDRDGDLDFLPSFLDGPSRGTIVYFENITQNSQPLTFTNRGALKTVTDIPVAGGAQAGGWFPSLVFVKDFDGDGDGRTDLILGNNNHCYLYRNLGTNGAGGWRLAEAVTLQADGKDIELFNPCFDMADIDRDGDWDLFGAPQSGQIFFFENIDTTQPRKKPTFAAGKVIAYDERYLQRSTHPRVKVADFTGDGLLDFVVDRAWELTDLDHPAGRDYGALFQNVGTPTSPRWKKVGATEGAPYAEVFQPCDAVRQNVVRAVDWNNDGKSDLLAGDCDGFLWLFLNRTDNRAPIFTPGTKLTAGGALFSRADHSGHARPDICDWNKDGRKDVVVSDGAGLVTAYLNEGTDAEPRLDAGHSVKFQNEQGTLTPIDRGSRSHLLVCDWDHDTKLDLILSDQENPGFYFFRNIGSNGDPSFAQPKSLGLNKYVRPNLGAFVDWDGDGIKDFIGCEFERSIRFYKNVGSGKPNEEPRFEDREGVAIVQPYSIMMISGADAVDWNGDGDLDILTGQGHGGSGLRFFERDYIESTLRGTPPAVRVVGAARR